MIGKRGRNDWRENVPPGKQVKGQHVAQGKERKPQGGFLHKSAKRVEAYGLVGREGEERRTTRFTFLTEQDRQASIVLS